MSEFYASISGSRGTATRQGSKHSGISGHIRGWHIGARVSCYYDPETDKDTVRIFKTGGSKGATPEELIAEFTD